MNNQQFDDDAWKPYMRWQATRGVSRLCSWRNCVRRFDI